MNQVEEARNLLTKVESITRTTLPIHIRARKAAARALLIQYLDHDKKSPDLLQAFMEAVKLDPDNLKCWNGAAKALWNKNDLQSARMCYTKCLENSPDKKAYQDLSMLQRQIAKGLKKHEERRELILDSVTNAKAAVALDVQDSHSWYILGNAYLGLAFCAPTEERDDLIDKSLKTYKHAMKVHEGPRVNFDLHFKYGVVCKYLEKHLDALRAFEYCGGDKVLSGTARESIMEITQTLSQLTTLIGTSCGLKAKKVAKIREAMEVTVAAWRGRHGAVDLAPLSALKTGQNPKNVALTCSLIYTVPVKSNVPLVYICMDSRGAFFALTIYGLEETTMPLSQSKSKTIQVVAPFVNNVEVAWQGKAYAFKSIRVNHVSSLLVDGKPVKSDQSRAKSAAQVDATHTIL